MRGGEISSVYIEFRIFYCGFLTKEKDFSSEKLYTLLELFEKSSDKGKLRLEKGVFTVEPNE